MAPTDNVWSESDTTPDAIEAALRELLTERHAEHDGVAPARALNMIAFVDQEWAGEIANRMRGLGRSHASRLIVLSYHPRRDQLDARASIAADELTPGEIALLRETVLVEIGPRHLDDLRTIADPLVVRDTPTLLWSPHRHPEAVEALLPLAQSVLIDSVDEPECEAAIAQACELSRKVYVVDLAWLRTTPWRERIAGAFDPPALRQDLLAIRKVHIAHHPDSAVVAMLLVGWLAAMLGWEVEPLRTHRASISGAAAGAGHEVALEIHAERSMQVRGLAAVALSTSTGRTITFERGDGGLLTRRRLSGGKQRSWLILGASRQESGILGEGIRQALLRDPSYRPALESAHQMTPR